MDKFAIFLMGLGVVAVCVFVFTILVYFLWPVVIPIAFPGLVSGGYIAAKLTFWQCFGLCLLIRLLIGSNSIKTE